MKINSNGIGLYYEVRGDQGDEGRPWLVLSHSLACSTAMWAPQLEEFSKTYRVLAFDTRGHGGSDAPIGPYTMDQLADDLFGLWTHLGIKTAHFAGLSMGGMIGQTFALKYPGLFRTLTLADTTSKWPAETLELFAGRVRTAREKGMASLEQSTLERWFTAPFREKHPDKVEQIGALIRTTPIEGYAGCCDAIPRINTTARLKDISCPILVIVGRDDPGTPRAMSEEIAANAPGAKLVVLDNAAHISNIEQPEKFNTALMQFLAAN